jgi:6-pyruvoyltetrahydropterin/6-carboxytetrahydropterin synthase
MEVELKGPADERGMVIDFKTIKQALQPLIDRWDHAVLVAESDDDLKAAAESLDSRYFIFPFDTTAENLSAYAADYFLNQRAELLADHQITDLRVRVYETDTCFAEITREVSTPGHEPRTRVVSAEPMRSVKS